MKNLSKKQVRETKAGKQISAWVILKNGKEVATVHAHYADGGTVTVDVWGKGSIEYQGRATGGGYDKLVSALSGAVIDGVLLFDHCGTDAQTAILLTEYKAAKRVIEESNVKAAAEHIGASFANYDSKKGKYSSLYYQGGLDRLKMMGYTVIKAI